MQYKKFLILMVVIVVVSILTSMISINLMKPILMAPQNEGTIITGGITTNTNVIIVDSSIVTGISNTVDFGVVNPGNSLSTDKTGAGVYPFLLRNEGNTDADVQAKFQTNRLFNQIDSHTYLWVENADTIASTDPGWRDIDDCAAYGGCLNAPADCSARGNCALTTSNKYILRSLNFEDCADEAYLHVGLDVSLSESGAHSAVVQVTGSESITQNAITC